MPRGGRRPGSGARKGNTNALKGGANSARLQLLTVALTCHPHKFALYRVGLELGAIPINKRDLDLEKVVRILYPAVFDPSHPRYNDIANPSCTEMESRAAARAIMNGETPLIVPGHNHQRPSKTTKDSQTPEATPPAERPPADSAQAKHTKDEDPSNI